MTRGHVMRLTWDLDTALVQIKCLKSHDPVHTRRQRCLAESVETDTPSQWSL